MEKKYSQTRMYPPVPPPVKYSLYSNTDAIERTRTELVEKRRINPLFGCERREKNENKTTKCAHSHKH